MKRLFLILLLVSYTISTLGIGISKFYCCGKLRSVSINEYPADTHDCKKKEGCCETKASFFKVTDSHVVADHVATPDGHVIIIPPAFTQLPAPIVADCAVIGYYSHAPPPFTTPSIYLLHCAFRI